MKRSACRASVSPSVNFCSTIRSVTTCVFAPSTNAPCSPPGSRTAPTKCPFVISTCRNVGVLRPVHRVARRDEHDVAARSHVLHRLREEVAMELLREELVGPVNIRSWALNLPNGTLLIARSCVLRGRRIVLEARRLDPRRGVEIARDRGRQRIEFGGGRWSSSSGPSAP